MPNVELRTDSSLLDSGEKIVEDLQIALLLLDMGQVRAFLEDHPFVSRDGLVNELPLHRSHLIVATRGEERRNRDFIQPISNIPVLQKTDDMELARTVHRVVNLRSRS